MMNCTAAERQDSAGVVYGDYMDGILAIIFNEGTDLTAESLIK
jgi:hypothetical protein